jgi:hypothetical protein
MEQNILSEHGLLLLQARYALKIKIKGLTQPQNPNRHLSGNDLDPLLHAFFFIEKFTSSLTRPQNNLKKFFIFILSFT